MSTVKEIEAAIRQLPAEDFAVLRAWLAEYDAAMWDKQIEDDVAHGRLDALAEEALEDFRQGRCTEI